MAEAVVSVALETFRDLLSEEARFLSGVGGEVRSLEIQLIEMKNLLKDADAKQHESESVRGWIRQIRDLAYRAEDAIETYAVEVSSQRGRGLKKLLSRFCCIMNQFHSLHLIGSDISQIKSDLSAVSKSMQDYGIRSIIQGESSNSATQDDNQKWKRQTFPDFQIEDCFVGKDNELKQIVSLLVEDKKHRVVSIWGMGGLGKTTIARKAYNHVDIKRHFQSFAWVCITQQCQIRSVLEDVLKQLNPQKRDAITSLSNTELIEELCQIQKAKRCITVLDDLWETGHWEGLKHAFLAEGLKSKILVTTRKQKVAEIGFSMQLGFLSMESGWELLKKKAFPGTNTPDFAFDENLLRKIGKEMVKKCGFLPLTICLLGGVLRKRNSMKEWELVKENIIAHLYRNDGFERENEIQAVLNLSYEDLPYYLKPCFLYLGLFKDDRHVDYIYKIWIANGMISHRNQEDESLSVIAELYLSELASRSIVDIEVLGGNSYCILHDVVRELCSSIGEREGFGVQNLYYEDGKLSRGSLSGVITRHLSIHFDGEFDGREFAITGDEDTWKNLRTLIILNDNEEKIEFLDFGIDIQILKLVRVLHFGGLKFEKRNLSKRIGNLIHVRYLKFDACEMDTIPSSITNLTYLHVLDLSTSWNVRVPNIFNKLLRLKHLMLPMYSNDRVGDFALELDEGLDELETLRGFDSSMHQLKSIIRLKNLRSFQAFVRDKESLLGVIDALDIEWDKLQWCEVIIHQGFELKSAEDELLVLKKVFACPRLSKLMTFVEIGKQLNQCGNCVSSSGIVELSLMHSEIEDNPMEMLGKLPVLRKLRLLSRSFVGVEMLCPALSFPQLRQIELEELPKLSKWVIEEGAMPLLVEIIIIDCPDLMMLPDGLRYISTLQELIIIGMPHLAKRILVSEEGGGEGEGEDFDKVRHVPSIIINN